MIKFLDNMISICLYAGLIGVFIRIGGWQLSSQNELSISLILGFFAGMINNIERVLRELFNKKNN